MKRHALMLATLFLCLAGCVPESSPFESSDVGPDSVFLYFLHGVGGVQSMAIRGPSGRITSDLGFGERMAAKGPCPEEEHCVPVAVDRSRGGTFLLKLDGRRVELDLTDELASFYPQETGTVIFNGSAVSPRATIVRHVQTVSEGCALTVINALSVANVETRPAGFEIAAEFRLDPETAGYEDERAHPISTRCGDLPTDVADHERFARAELYDLIAERPWFHRVACEDAGECFRWAAEDSRIGEEGRFHAPPTTAEYRACLAEAISAPATCPEGELRWEDVAIDESTGEACAAPATHQARLTPPGEADTLFGKVACETDFRVRTPGQDLVFTAREGEAAHHQDGELVRSGGQVPLGAERFWTLFGRPVEPSTFTWDSSDTFVALESFPGE